MRTSLTIQQFTSMCSEPGLLPEVINRKERHHFCSRESHGLEGEIIRRQCDKCNMKRVLWLQIYTPSVGNAGRKQDRIESITMLINLNCEICEFYSLYIDKIRF